MAKWSVGYPINFTASGDLSKEAVYKSCIQEVDKIYAHLNLVRNKFESDASVNILAELDTIADLPATGTKGDAYRIISTGQIAVWAERDGAWRYISGSSAPEATESVLGITKLGTMAGEPRPGTAVTEDVLIDHGYLTGYDIPRGCIIPWWGNVAAIPVGWAYCDGTQGTPDYRGLFLRGGDEELGNGGEDETLVQNSSLIPHTHNFSAAVEIGNHQHGLEGSMVAEAFNHNHVANVSPGNSAPAGQHNHSAKYYVGSFQNAVYREVPPDTTFTQKFMIAPVDGHMGTTYTGTHNHSATPSLQVDPHTGSHNHQAYGNTDLSSAYTLSASGTTEPVKVTGEKKFNNVPAYMDIIYIMKM
jgi:hypothetical protein